MRTRTIVKERWENTDEPDGKASKRQGLKKKKTQRASLSRTARFMHCFFSFFASVLHRYAQRWQDGRALRKKMSVEKKDRKSSNNITKKKKEGKETQKTRLDDHQRRRKKKRRDTGIQIPILRFLCQQKRGTVMHHVLEENLRKIEGEKKKKRKRKNGR